MNLTKPLIRHNSSSQDDAADMAPTAITGPSRSLDAQKLSATHHSFADYTVFGVYEGCADRYASLVLAGDAAEALKLATEEWRERNEHAEVPVRLCGIVKGRHRPLDADYALPGWRRSDVLLDRQDAQALLCTQRSAARPIEFTVIALSGTRCVIARDALEAELHFDAEDVAAVIAGNVLNEFSKAKSNLRASKKPFGVRPPDARIS